MSRATELAVSGGLGDQTARHVLPKHLSSEGATEPVAADAATDSAASACELGRQPFPGSLKLRL